MSVLARKRNGLASDGQIGSTTLDDSIAMRRIAEGEINEIEKIIAGYGLIIWTLARKFTNTPEEAMAAESEIVMDIIKYAGEFDPAKTGLITFIKQVSHRRLIKDMEFAEKVRLPR